MAKYMIEASERANPRALSFIPSPGGVDSVPGGTNVLKEKDGNVTVLDKFKEYYKFAITLVGMLLVVLTSATSAFEFIPIADKYLTVTIAVLTTLSVLLKRNEKWVEEL